jgi:hypothetical protein
MQVGSTVVERWGRLLQKKDTIFCPATRDGKTDAIFPSHPDSLISRGIARSLLATTVAQVGAAQLSRQPSEGAAEHKEVRGGGARGRLCHRGLRREREREGGGRGRERDAATEKEGLVLLLAAVAVREPGGRKEPPRSPPPPPRSHHGRAEEDEAQIRPPH